MFRIRLTYPTGETQLHPAHFKHKLQAEAYIPVLEESKRFDHLTIIRQEDTQLDTQTNRKNTK